MYFFELTIVLSCYVFKLCQIAHLVASYLLFLNSNLQPIDRSIDYAYLIILHTYEKTGLCYSCIVQNLTYGGFSPRAWPL